MPTAMSCPGPGSGDPASRRSSASAQSFDHLATYEVAVHRGEGCAYLRVHGLHSSLISEWRGVEAAGEVERVDTLVVQGNGSQVDPPGGFWIVILSLLCGLLLRLVGVVHFIGWTVTDR